ncbi:MAG: UDP-N-acetylmuramoyl-L-alanyl-D-glutamate--2,6-diaminopimelate ligase [Gammaproteobacteria bacterium]|nr:UDP-N-acetylmuramoyl-L-alanyl-D-glutamate--2,6-diaminopimelate ligase [Gammaproteobacteria bacterium]
MLPARNRHSGMPLRTLLQGLTDPVTAPDNINQDLPIRGLSADSRNVRAGDLFLACRGSQTRGSLFIRDAIKAGAAAVVVDEALQSDLDRRLGVVIPVANLRDKLGLIAGRFYRAPTRRLRLAGVTGTNGKTSICWWAAQLHSLLTGQPAGLVGTLGYGSFPKLVSGPNTTPGAIELQRLCAGFVDAGMDTAFMEVSSHALDQGRVNGIDFDMAVFTNLSRDHLDYHHSLDEYFAAKQKLFAFPSLRTAVVNCDDEYGRKILQSLPARVDAISYGMAGGRRQHTVRATLTPPPPDASASGAGLALAVASPWGHGQARLQVTGTFNAGNILAVIALLCLAGLSLEQVLAQLENLTPVPGRMESFTRADGARIVVDYAHTPAALEQALLDLRQAGAARLICVFGCGGERDRDKRALMGEVAERLATDIILTDDNPRGEAGADIIADILSGISHKGAVTVERNRSGAIALALHKAGPGDVALIAGKGHETCQEIAGRRYPFSDRQQVRQLLEQAA